MFSNIKIYFNTIEIVNIFFKNKIILNSKENLIKINFSKKYHII